MKIQTVFTLDADDFNDEKVVDVHQWTELLKVAPTECFNKGEKLPNKKKSLVRSSFWSLASPEESNKTICEQLSSIIKPLLIVSDEIRSLVDEFDLDSGFAIFVWLEGEEEVSDMDLHIDSELVKDLGKLSADFGIRVYDYLKG